MTASYLFLCVCGLITRLPAGPVRVSGQAVPVWSGFRGVIQLTAAAFCNLTNPASVVSHMVLLELCSVRLLLFMPTLKGYYCKFNPWSKSP